LAQTCGNQHRALTSPRQRGMADWDPFADPSDSVAPAPSGSGGGAAEPAASDSKAAGAGGGLWEEFEEDDIFAALRVPPKEPRHWTWEEFEPLLDALFDIKDDSDVTALRAAMKPIAEALADNGSFVMPLWKRAVPLMMDLVDKKAAAPRPNLFGLLVDQQVGLMSDADSAKMNEIAVEPPEGVTPSGVVIFMYGWGGGTLGDMQDMRDHYRELFPAALIARLACCRKGSFGLRVQCGIAIKAALKLWTEAPEGTKPKLLVHVFSNAGFFTHTEMLQSWKALSSKEEPDPLLGQALPPMESVLRGVFYDSSPDCNIALGPCLQSIVQGFAGFIHHIVASDHDGTPEGEKKAEWEARRVVQVLIGEQSPVKAHLRNKPEKLVTKMSCEDGNVVNRLEPAVNMVFLYSVDDTIINYKAVEAYIERVMKRDRMKAMVHPRRVRFDKSKHCFHKMIHREEYFKCVRQFSTGVLTN